MKRFVVSFIAALSAVVVLSSAASYPTSVKIFTTRVAGDTIQPGHINDLQDEVTAIETNLLETWTTVSHSAGNFTGSGTLVWTVASGDQTHFKYSRIGKRVLVNFGFDTTTVSGTGNTLQIPIPGSLTAASPADGFMRYIDAGTAGVGYCFVTTSGATIGLRKQDGSNWGAATDTTYVRGQIWIEVS